MKKNNNNMSLLCIGFSHAQAFVLKPNMTEFPVRRTFIHFNAPLPSTRSASAPPARYGQSSLRVTNQRKVRKSVPSSAEEDEAVLLEYRAKAIGDAWMNLAERLCDQRIRNALSQSSFVPRLRGSLPRHLFRDWVFYTFVLKNRTAILKELYRIGFIYENKNANSCEFWSADIHYLEHQNAFLRTLVAEAEKLLEAMEKGFFSVLVNGDIVVCISYCTRLMLKDVIAQTRAVLHMEGHKKAVAKHRNRTLHNGKLSDQGIGAGSFFTLDLF